MPKSNYLFDCQLYVPAFGLMTFRMPVENGPRRVIRLQTVDHDELIEPGFRRLLAAFDSIPSHCA
jgi:hypothetical protein